MLTEDVIKPSISGLWTNGCCLVVLIDATLIRGEEELKLQLTGTISVNHRSLYGTTHLLVYFDCVNQSTWDWPPAVWSRSVSGLLRLMAWHKCAVIEWLLGRFAVWSRNDVCRRITRLTQSPAAITYLHTAPTLLAKWIIEYIFMQSVILLASVISWLNIRTHVSDVT